MNRKAWVAGLCAWSIAATPTCGGKVEPSSSDLWTAGGNAGSGGTTQKTDAGSADSAAGSSGKGGSAAKAGSGGSAGVAGASGQGGATGGSGGSGGVATGGAGSGGAATGGSAGFPCSQLEPIGNPVGLNGSSWEHQRGPQLVFTSESGSQVALGIAARQTESPGPVPDRPLLAGFEPWTAMLPATLDLTSKAPFVVSLGHFLLEKGTAPGAVSIAYPAVPSPPGDSPTSIAFNPQLDSKTGTSSADSAMLVTGADTVVRFLREGSQLYLAGFDSGSTLHSFGFSEWWKTPSGGASHADIGCGNYPLVGDALGWGDGFLFAVSSTAEFGTCPITSAIEIPSKIELGWLHPGPGTSLEPLKTVIESGNPPQPAGFVKLVAHAQGAWVVYQFDDIYNTVPPPLQALKVDSNGVTLTGPFIVANGTAASGRPAATRLGENLVVAWVHTPDPESYVVVTVFDPQGMPLSMVTTPPVSHAAGILPELSVLGSPAGDQLLVAWTEHGTADNPLQKVWLQRYGCAHGL